MNISVGQNCLNKKTIWVYSSSPHKWGRNNCSSALLNTVSNTKSLLKAATACQITRGTEAISFFLYESDVHRNKSGFYFLKTNIELYDYIMFCTFRFWSDVCWKHWPHSYRKYCSINNFFCLHLCQLYSWITKLYNKSKLSYHFIFTDNTELFCFIDGNITIAKKIGPPKAFTAFSWFFWCLHRSN